MSYKANTRWPDFSVSTEPMRDMAFRRQGLTAIIAAREINPRAAFTSPAAAALFTAYPDLIEAIVQAQASLPHPSFSVRCSVSESIVQEVTNALDASESVCDFYNHVQQGAPSEKLRDIIDPIRFPNDAEPWQFDPLAPLDVATVNSGFDAKVVAANQNGDLYTVAVTSRHYATILLHAKYVAEALMAARQILSSAWTSIGEESPQEVMVVIDHALQKAAYAQLDTLAPSLA